LSATCELGVLGLCASHRFSDTAIQISNIFR
jgi:hypothetical protein